MKILTNKKGVTLLEGLIALLLLALVATGTFGVLLSTSRKSSEPDIREEMALAIERAQQMLQVYVTSHDDTASADDVGDDIGCGYAYTLSSGLCKNDSSGGVFKYPLSSGHHNIDCLLPPICDRNNSEFYYQVSTVSDGAVRPRNADLAKMKGANANLATGNNVSSSEEIRVFFKISCNGYTL